MICLTAGTFGAPQYGNIQHLDEENFVRDEKVVREHNIIVNKATRDNKVIVKGDSSVIFNKQPEESEVVVSETNVDKAVGDEEFPFPKQPKVSETIGSGKPRAAAPVSCRTEYTTLWSTQYTETETQVCTTVYVNQCENLIKKNCVNVPRQECTTVQDRQCSTEYNEVCVDEYRTEYDEYTETECTTEYKEDCEYRWEGAGYEKVWAPIPGTCKSNPFDTCVDVPKQKEKQVAYPVCTNVPHQKCVNVPRQECRTLQEQKCSNEPYQTCNKVPSQNCETVHKKVPTRVSRKAPKKVCDGSSGYTAGQGSGLGISVRSGADAIQFQEE